MKAEIAKIEQMRSLLKEGKLLESLREGIALSRDAFPDFYYVFVANLELYETYLQEKTRGLIISHKLEQLTYNIINALRNLEQYVLQAHEAYLKQGNKFFSIRNYEAALENYEKALEHKRDFVPALIGMGQAYYGLKDYDRAIACFDEAIQYNQYPFNAEAYQYKGNAWLMKSDLTQASQAYEVAQKLENLNFANPIQTRWSSYVKL